MSTTKTHELVGKTVRAVFLAEDRAAIKLELSTGDCVVGLADGDCCSSTWIEDVIGVDALIDQPITSVEELELPEHLKVPTKTDNYEEEMQYYGLALRTNKGTCTIAYRNSSNGYYGGSLVWPGDGYYGGVHNQNVSKQTWESVEERS